MNDEKLVGPVVQAGNLGSSIVQAIRDSHPDAQLLDRGAYIRVLVPHRCVLDRKKLEARYGSPVEFPSILEGVMSSFMGRLEISKDRVIWDSGGAV